MIGILDIVRDIIQISRTEDLYYDWVPDNSTVPYFRLQIISSNQNAHKDGNDTQIISSTPYTVLKPYHQRYRVQIDFVSDGKEEAYESGVMGLLGDNLQDHVIGSKSYTSEVINQFTLEVENEGQQYFMQVLEIYLNEYQ